MDAPGSMPTDIACTSITSCVRVSAAPSLCTCLVRSRCVVGLSPFPSWSRGRAVAPQRRGVAGAHATELVSRPDAAIGAAPGGDERRAGQGLTGGGRRRGVELRHAASAVPARHAPLRRGVGPGDRSSGAAGGPGLYRAVACADCGAERSRSTGVGGPSRTADAVPPARLAEPRGGRRLDRVAWYDARPERATAGRRLSEGCEHEDLSISPLHRAFSCRLVGHLRVVEPAFPQHSARCPCYRVA